MHRGIRWKQVTIGEVQHRQFKGADDMACLHSPEIPYLDFGKSGLSVSVSRVGGGGG